VNRVDRRWSAPPLAKASETSMEGHCFSVASPFNLAHCARMDLRVFHSAITQTHRGSGLAYRRHVGEQSYLSGPFTHSCRSFLYGYILLYVLDITSGYSRFFQVRPPFSSQLTLPERDVFTHRHTALPMLCGTSFGAASVEDQVP
jgi:hypothetical protein